MIGRLAAQKKPQIHPAAAKRQASRDSNLYRQSSSTRRADSDTKERDLAQEHGQGQHGDTLRGKKAITLSSGSSDQSLTRGVRGQKLRHHHSGVQREFRYEGYTGPWENFVEVCRQAHRIVESDWFNTFIILVIVIAGALVGIQTYEGMEGNIALSTLDTMILTIFSVEVGLKILAEGLSPWNYWVGPDWRWNNFDFVIVVLSMPFIPFGGSSVAILRMSRLMRVMKLVKKVPQLQMIVMGLIGGVKSIAYILILLFLVFYLYGVAGIYAFSVNDPWHFGSLPIALNTLFRMATLEDWTDVLYINYFGCDGYRGNVYTVFPSDTESLAANSSTERDFKDGVCYASNPQPMLATGYFLSFIVVSALVMLSLFVGAVTMSMAESMEEMKILQEEAEKQRKFERARAAAERNKSHNRIKRGKTVADLSFHALLQRQKMAQVLSEAMGESEDFSSASSLDIPGGRSGGAKHMQMNLEAQLAQQLQPWQAKVLLVADYCKRIVESHRFSVFITAVILLAGLLVGLQTDKSIEKDAAHIFSVLDTLILVVFSVEVLLKILAEGFMPWRYFKSSWNTFDFIIVVACVLPGMGSMITILRLLRLLRVLKLVKSLPQLQVIVTALLKGVKSIGFIGIILFLVFYVCAIGGMILFKENDPWHFGTLHFAMITLFRCATLEDWTDVMYINMLGCDHYGYGGREELCTKPQALGWVSTCYFLTFIVIGALVLLTLFVGVVTTSMEEATMEMKEERFIEEKVRQIQKEFDVDDETIKLYKIVFDMLDLDGGGSVEEEELGIGLNSIGKFPTSEELRDMMNKVDGNQSGDIDFAEFVEFMLNVKTEGKKQKQQGAEEVRLDTIRNSGSQAECSTCASELERIGYQDEKKQNSVLCRQENNRTTSKVITSGRHRGKKSDVLPLPAQANTEDDVEKNSPHKTRESFCLQSMDSATALMDEILDETKEADKDQTAKNIHANEKQRGPEKSRKDSLDEWLDDVCTS